MDPFCVAKKKKTSAIARWYLFVVLAYYHRPVQGQVVNTHGPARVDNNPIFLDSFVPASMQVIAHVTELMKYEPAVPVTTTPATPATRPHKPGVFAPVTPPTIHLQRWPQRPITTTTTTRRPWWKLGEVQQREYPDGGYFNRYRNGWSFSALPDQRSRSLESNDEENDLDLLGVLPIDLYKRINTIPDFDDESDLFGQVEKFTDDYDDKAPPFLRKKRPPPTRAYVTLLSLYDSLNKEAKKLSLNKYAGYSRRTLEDLEKFAMSTSAYQLEKVLSKVVERRDITDQQIVKKIKTMVDDLQQDDSYINQALADIPPLAFDVHF